MKTGKRTWLVQRMIIRQLTLTQLDGHTANALRRQAKKKPDEFISQKLFTPPVIIYFLGVRVLLGSYSYQLCTQVKKMY